MRNWQRYFDTNKKAYFWFFFGPVDIFWASRILFWMRMSSAMAFPFETGVGDGGVSTLTGSDIFTAKEYAYIWQP